METPETPSDSTTKQVIKSPREKKTKKENRIFDYNQKDECWNRVYC